MPKSEWMVFAAFRRVVVFLLGVAVVLDALAGNSDTLTELIIGAIMVGVLPIDNLVALLTLRRPSELTTDNKLGIDRDHPRDIPSQAHAKAPSAPDQEAPLSD